MACLSCGHAEGSGCSMRRRTRLGDGNHRDCKDYEFLVLFTSTPGWTGDQKNWPTAIKNANPKIRIASWTASHHVA